MAALHTRCSALGMAVLVLSCLISGPLIASATALPKLESGYQKIHSYIQEYGNVTFFPVVPPVPGHGIFGGIYVSDENATETPDPASPVVARVKGIIVAVDNDPNSTTGLNLDYTVIYHEGGAYGHSSTVSVHGYLDLNLPFSVLPITGGTGKFLLARGWVQLSTYFQDPAKGRYIREAIAHIYYGK